MVPYQKRGKLDEKSFDCIYMRYADDAKAFRLYDMNANRIVISRDVVFLENEMHTVNEKSINNVFHMFSQKMMDMSLKTKKQLPIKGRILRINQQLGLMMLFKMQFVMLEAMLMRRKAPTIR